MVFSVILPEASASKEIHDLRTVRNRDQAGSFDVPRLSGDLRADVGRLGHCDVYAFISAALYRLMATGEGLIEKHSLKALATGILCLAAAVGIL